VADPVGHLPEMLVLAAPWFRMAVVFLKTSALLFLLAAVSSAFAQQQPPVKVNVLNVCTPSAEDQKQIASALALVPKRPPFSPDFEVARGRSSLTEAPSFLQAGASAQMSGEPSVASFVRVRREFTGQSTFSTVQYSFSDDGKMMVETLVLHVRDPKELVQVSIEDDAASVTSAATMLASTTPASRIKLERFGKSSVVLARCAATEAGPAPDQSAYEPLFTSASTIMTNYRGLLEARQMVPAELARVASQSTGKPGKAAKPAASKTEHP
jgi:hypothetical protein